MKNFPSIKKNDDFRIVKQTGRKKTAGSLIMYVRENGTDTSRIGITISHREGNSVVRHTFVRRMREIFRFYNNATVPGNDIVIIARNQAGSASFDSLKEDYRRLLSYHNLYEESQQGR